MSDFQSTSIDINNLQPCVPVPKQLESIGNTSLRETINVLNRKVAQEQKKPEDSTFSETDFNFAAKQSWGKGLTQWKNFSDFSNWISNYQQGQRCADARHKVERIPHPESVCRMAFVWREGIATEVSSLSIQMLQLGVISK